MTKDERIENMWEMLRKYGIETIEQFEEAYKDCPKIDITPFVSPLDYTKPEAGAGPTP